MESYWNLSEPEVEKTQETIDFISKQAEMLDDQSNHAVAAVFTKMRVSSFQKLNKMNNELSQVLSRVHTGKNASKLYNQKWYEFYVTDALQEYELPIFDLGCNDEYPITLLIDEDIAAEADLPSKYEISSSAEFKETFIKILKTNKIRYVIRKLMRMQRTCISQ